MNKTNEYLEELVEKALNNFNSLYLYPEGITNKDLFTEKYMDCDTKEELFEEILINAIYDSEDKLINYLTLCLLVNFRRHSRNPAKSYSQIRALNNYPDRFKFIKELIETCFILLTENSLVKSCLENNGWELVTLAKNPYGFKTSAKKIWLYRFIKHLKEFKNG